MRELYEVIDKRVADFIGGRPVTLLRGHVTEVAPTGYRLAAVIDGQSEGTPDIPYDLALSPVVDDDVLLLRRSDGLLFAFAILRREGSGEATGAEAVEVFIAAKARYLGPTSYPPADTWTQIPLDTVDWDTDGMYSAPGRLTVHHSGLYKVVGSIGYNRPVGFTGSISTRITRNGDTSSSVGGDLWLDAGDHLEAWIYWTGSGGTPYVTGATLELVGYVIQHTTRTYGPEPVGVQAYNDTTQSLTSGLWSTLSLNTERWDTDAFHDNTTNNSRLTVPAGKSGYYSISGSTHFNFGSATGGRILRLLKNGVTSLRESGAVAVVSSHGARHNISDVAYLSAGDYIEIQGYQDSGSALDVGSATQTGLQTTLTMTALTTYPSDRTEAPDRSIGARVIRETGLTLPAAVAIPIPWVSAQTDTDGFWTAALPERLTIPANCPSGLYLLNLETYWPAGNTGTMTARWRKNGADVLSPDDYVGVNGSSDNHVIVWASPGDYFDTLAFAASGGTLGGTSFYAKTVGSIAYLGSGSAAGAAVMGTWVERSTVQNIGAGVEAALSFDTEVLDQGGWWSSSPYPTRITVAQTGWYSYEAGCKFEAPTTAGKRCHLRLRKNGDTQEVCAPNETDTSAGVTTLLGISGSIYLSAGDYLEAWVTNGDTAAKNLVAGSPKPFFRLVKMASGADTTLEVAPIEDAPGAAVYNSAAQSVPTGTTTVITYNTVERDSHGFYSAGTPNRFTIPAGHAGLYTLTARTRFGSSDTSNRTMDLYKNGSSIASQVYGTPGGFDTWALVAQHVYLAVGDYVDFRVWHQAGSNVDYGIAGYPGQLNRFTITRLATSLQGPKGDPGADVFAEGTSWPLSPTEGQVYRRLDLDRMLFRWNGSYWLSEQRFVVSCDRPNLENVDIAQQYRSVARGPGAGCDGWWLERSYWRYYRANTSTYFTVTPYWGTVPTGALATWTSSGVTGWGVFKAEHGFYRARNDANNGHYEVTMTHSAGGTPGTVHALLVSTEYRLAYAGA